MASVSCSSRRRVTRTAPLWTGRERAQTRGRMSRGVTCSRCGASTPLPDDLTVPSFACAFCHAVLETAAYAGQAAVSADALLGYVGAALESGVGAPESAPRFEGGSTSPRAASCRHCAAPVEVPLDVSVRELSCAGCGRRQPVSDYVSDEERFALDMQRQVAGNEALVRLRAEGVPCGKCGAKSAVPDDGSVQLVCPYCGATILLSDHVDASAVARARLKHGVYAVRSRRVNIVVGLIVVGLVVFNLLWS